MELRRFAYRRLVRVLLLLTVLAILFFAFIAWVRADSSFSYVALDEILRPLAVPLMMLWWLLGASFMGAEWHHRSITTLLTWEPRRSVAFGAKLGAVILGSFVGAVMVQAVVIIAFYPAAAAHGGFGGVNGDWFRSVADVVARSAGISAMAGALGFAVATLGRNTAAAFGTGFVYLAVVENLIRGYRPQWRSWLIGENIAALMFGQIDFLGGRSGAEAAAVLALYTVALTLIAGAAFKLRDVA